MQDTRQLSASRLLWLREQAQRSGNTAALAVLNRLLDERARKIYAERNGEHPAID